MERENRPNIFERSPKRTLVIVSVFLFFVLDILIAQGLIALDVYDPPRKFQAGYRTKHPVYNHTLKKNVSEHEVYWGPLLYTVSTNSLGFRDRTSRNVGLAGDRPRVVLIGDSFAEGIGVQYPDTFSGLVDAVLADRGVEVLNAGVASYSPIIYLRKIEFLLDIGFRFDHLIVFIDLSDIRNEIVHYRFDGDRNVVDRSPPGLGSALREWLSDNTVFYSIVRLWMRKLRHELKDQKREKHAGLAVDNYQANWTIDEDLYARWGREGLKLASEHMDQLYDLSREYGFSIAIAVYPWPDQIWHSDTDSVQVRFWGDWAEDRMIPFINFFPSFIGDSSERENIIGKYFIKDDFHWNQAGHQLVAEGLLQHLNEIFTDRRNAE